MTGRQDTSPVASVKAENIQKDQTCQVQDDMIRRPELIKQSKRAAVTQKQSRPPMELYRPPKIMQKNGTKVHFADDNQLKRSPSAVTPLPVELKSALKRSKSFTADESRELEKTGFQREAFPLEYQGLIRQAVLDPNSLSYQKLMELVRLICCKAVENVQYSAPAARLCFSIIEKEHNHTFLESLQNCCKEWYDERDKLLRSSFLTSVGTTVSGLRRWTAYVLFLIELYHHVKNQQCQIVQPTGNQVISPHPNSPMGYLALTLQMLLYECANIISKPPSVNSEGEIEILRRMLYMVGKQLEIDSSQRMEQLVCNLRDAFLSPSTSSQTRKTLLEMIELHLSDWQLDEAQTKYYFRFTKVSDFP